MSTDANHDRSAGEATEQRPLARRLLTIRETAEILGVSRSMVYQLVASDDLETVHIGRAIRVPTAAIDDFIARLRARRAS